MKRLITVVIAVALGASMLPASADAENRGHDDGRYEHHDGYRHEEDRREIRHEREREERHEERREERWVRGHALPREYHRVIVNDYRYYHLRRPPYGYRWVQVDNDYLLVAVASGVIADIILSH